MALHFIAWHVVAAKGSAKNMLSTAFVAAEKIQGYYLVPESIVCCRLRRYGEGKKLRLHSFHFSRKDAIEKRRKPPIVASKPFLDWQK